MGQAGAGFIGRARRQLHAGQGTRYSRQPTGSARVTRGAFLFRRGSAALSPGLKPGTQLRDAGGESSLLNVGPFLSRSLVHEARGGQQQNLTRAVCSRLFGSWFGRETTAAWSRNEMRKEFKS